jgi:hypothetical protein
VPPQGVFCYLRRMHMKMPWKIIIIFVLGMLIAGGSKILAQQQAPVISYACEGKSGALTVVNDGWSNKTECKGNNQRLVRLGNQGPNGTGNIMFIYRTTGENIFALTADGNIYGNIGKGWIPPSAIAPSLPDSLPAEVPPTSVAQWMLVHLLDIDGNVWWYSGDTQTWMNIGHP